MAWISSGTGILITQQKDLGHGYPSYGQTDNGTFSTDTDHCLFVLKDSTSGDHNNITTYILYSCARGSDSIVFAGNITITNNVTYVNADTGETSQYTSSSFPQIMTGTDTFSNQFEVFSTFTSTIPIFNDGSSALKYVKNGDDSGRVLSVNTDWDLYIDGTKSPLYKLTWDCADIKSSDTSRVKVMFCGYEKTVDAYIVKETHYYGYNKKSVKLNYHDIYEAVWGDLGGMAKSPVTIIVQFEYFDATTVMPKDTSSYMYCVLYPNETNGHMYGDIGFCEKGSQSTWFVKTDSGDSSTFTAHDGTEGSDGYTKDDDKGYHDNKDKDDDDSDTKVLSSGIGVLTSTFHMTKERLEQLGQFLWGGSIFDEFSLINNNPIENYSRNIFRKRKNGCERRKNIAKL